MLAEWLPNGRLVVGRIVAAARRQVFGTLEKPVADRDPPKVPPGWRTGPPDFVGVGVQRAGTTWWFAELRRHPSLTLARDSEGAPLLRRVRRPAR